MRLTDLSWPAIDRLPKSTPVVIPIAALEQHGHHLPLFVDSYLLGEIVRRVEDRLTPDVLFAPLQWLGNSQHHLDFPGTLSAAPRPYLDLLNEALENFLTHGFTRLLLLNGHGGNDVPARQAVFETRQRHRDRNELLLLSATYWHLADPLRTSTLPFHQKEMGHACEWETSMMLRLAPNLVGNYKDAPAVESGVGFHPAVRGWITRERTHPGHIGHPARATPDKGEALFAAFADGATGLLERMLRWDGRSWDG